jgi:WD40 repeat protein
VTGAGTLAAAQQRLDSPYVGLGYYTEEYAPMFFGRESERRMIIANLRASRLTLLYAHSGVGKSSLLRAGVAARLRELAERRRRERGSAGFFPVVFGAWKDDPAPALIREIEAATEYFAGEPVDLPAGRLDEALAAAADRLDATILVILDQFEEYLLYSSREQRQFADELARCINLPELHANFLIAIREDAYAGLGDLFKGEIPNLYGNYLHLEYLDRAAAREAITKPIARFNELHPEDVPIEVEDGLVEAVLDQVRTGEVVLDQVGQGTVAADGGARADQEIETPYLQLVMTRLWKEERDAGSRVLRIATLTKLGGAQEIVRTHLDKLLDDLSASERRTAIDVFHHLVTKSGAKIAHSAADLADYTERTEAQITALLEMLCGEPRILRPIPRPAGAGGPQRYEIYSDVLAPAILDWRARAVAALEHERLQREKADEEARARAERERLERENRDERERAAKLRRMLIGTGVALCVAVIAGGVAIWALIRASDERDAARSRALAARSEAALAADPPRAVQYALDALRISDTGEAETALRQALPRMQAPLATFPTSGTYLHDATLSPDDATVATATGDGAVTLWNARRGGRRRIAISPGQGLNRVAFSPDGSMFATASDDGRVTVRRTATPTTTDKALRVGAHVVDASFNRAGTEIVAGDAAGVATVWDLATSHATRIHVESVPGLQTVETASFSPDGSQVVTASDDGAARIFGAAGGKQRGPAFQVSASPLTSASFSPDGSELVVASSDGTARIWDVKSRRQLRVFRLGDAVTSAAFAPDGRRIVTTAGRQATVWDTTTGATLTQLVRPGVLRRAGFSSDGLRVVTAETNGTAMIWDAWPRELLGSVAVSAAPLGDAEFGSSGSEVATASDDGSWRLWSLAGTALTPAVKPKLGPLSKVCFAPRGQVLLVASSGNGQLFDAAGRPAGKPLGSALNLEDCAFGLGGSVLTEVFASHAQLATGLRLRPPARLRSATPERAATSRGGGVTLVVYFNDSSGTDTAVAYDTRSGRPLGAFALGPSPFDPALSPDGRVLATADSLGNVTLFSVPSGKELGGLGDVHVTRAADLVDFSPDGRRLLTAGSDGFVRIWDVKSRSELTELSTLGAGIRSARFSPGGDEIVTSGDDGVMRFFSTRLAGRTRELKAIAARYLRGSGASG